jgi:hypothetical protein
MHGLPRLNGPTPSARHFFLATKQSAAAHSCIAPAATGRPAVAAASNRLVPTASATAAAAGSESAGTGGRPEKRSRTEGGAGGSRAAAQAAAAGTQGGVSLGQPAWPETSVHTVRP